MSPSKIPSQIRLHKASKQLELCYGDTRYQLSAEYLRVFSPSAEVRGHAAEQAVLQVGKRNVAISTISRVGNYAIQPVFDDGHDSGIYSWDYLYDLAHNIERNWADYVQRLRAAGGSRDGDKQVLKFS